MTTPVFVVANSNGTDFAASISVTLAGVQAGDLIVAWGTLDRTGGVALGSATLDGAAMDAGSNHDEVFGGQRGRLYWGVAANTGTVTVTANVVSDARPAIIAAAYRPADATLLHVDPKPGGYNSALHGAITSASGNIAGFFGRWQNYSGESLSAYSGCTIRHEQTATSARLFLADAPGDTSVEVGGTTGGSVQWFGIGFDIVAGNTATAAQAPTFGADAGTASPTLAYGSNVVAGNLLVFAAVWIADTVPTITDSQGNTWQLCKSQLSYDSSQRAAIWSALAGSSGANTITFAKGAAVVAEYVALEYNWDGVVATPDDTNGDTGSGVGSPSYNLVTTAANELLVAIWRSTDGSQSPTSPWVNLGPSPSFQSYFYGSVAHQLNSGAAGTKAVNMYMAPLSHTSAAAAFKIGGGSPPVEVEIQSDDVFSFAAAM
jgi:hypothetical protein